MNLSLSNVNRTIPRMTAQPYNNQSGPRDLGRCGTERRLTAIHRPAGATSRLPGPEPDLRDPLRPLRGRLRRRPGAALRGRASRGCRPAAASQPDAAGAAFLGAPPAGRRAAATRAVRRERQRAQRGRHHRGTDAAGSRKNASATTQVGERLGGDRRSS